MIDYSKRPSVKGAMPKAEIVRCLRKYRYDPVLSRGMKSPAREFPLRTIAGLARLGPNDKADQDLMNRLVAGEYMTNRVQRALSPVIRSIEEGRIKIVRRTLYKRNTATERGQRGYHGVEVTIEYIDPPSGPAPRLDKLSPAGDWRPFARCRNCGGQRWESVVIRESAFYACRACVPDTHFAAMGGRRATKEERLGLPETTMKEDYSLCP